jgi:cyclomaltodextrinase / maltogenic alpha-amylase / neopullulanase
MDFVFGTLATDDLKLIHHRVLRRGVQHHHHTEPLDPLPGQPVTLTVRVGQDVLHDHVTVYYTVDGTTPEGTRGSATNGDVIELDRVDYIWDTLAWSYIAVWRVTLPPQPEGVVVRYQMAGRGRK